MERAHVWVSGKVQGVFYRDSTRQVAERLGLAGWVRNLKDGRVEAVFEGAPEAVREAVQWCRRGPSAARVDDVEVRMETPEGLASFERRSTADASQAPPAPTAAAPAPDEDAELAAIRARTLQQIQQRAMAAQQAPAPSAGVPIEATDAALPQLLKDHPLALVDCWAPWCGPCHRIAPVIDELAREMTGQVAFLKLNVDENPVVSQAFQVQSIPTLLVFQQGRLVDRIVGAVPKGEIVARLRRFMRSRSGTPGPRRI